MAHRGRNDARALTSNASEGANPAAAVPLAAVGEPDDGNRAHEGTRTHLLERGRQFVREHGRPPTSQDIKRGWYEAIRREFGTINAYVVELGFRPRTQGGTTVPAAPILEAVQGAIGVLNLGGTDPEAGVHTLLGKTLARRIRLGRQNGVISEQAADEILCRIGRTDLWHSDPRLWGIGCVTTSGEALLPDE